MRESNNTLKGDVAVVLFTLKHTSLAYTTDGIFRENIIVFLSIYKNKDNPVRFAFAPVTERYEIHDTTHAYYTRVLRLFGIPILTDLLISAAFFFSSYLRRTTMQFNRHLRLCSDSRYRSGTGFTTRSFHIHKCAQPKKKQYFTIEPCDFAQIFRQDFPAG